MRLAVIGDVGGHLRQLQEALTDLGADPATFALPDDLVVCQVGDLVHRGPDSVGTLKLVDRLMKDHPGQWHQLCGNHEAQYIFPPRFAWPEVLPLEGTRLLQSWWESGQMTLAAAFDTLGEAEADRIVGAGELLVTHAGLTIGLWRRLQSPRTAVDAATAVNALRTKEISSVWKAGTMLGPAPSIRAGVVWAEAPQELYAPWRDTTGPGFHQAHGHSTAFDWRSGQWRQPVGSWIDAPDRPAVKLDRVKRHVRVELPEQVIWGVDPGHEFSHAPVWAPLVLPLA